MALFDFAIGVVIFLILIGGLYFLWTMRRHQLTSGDWEVKQHSGGNGILITVEKRGEKPFVVGLAKQSEQFEEEYSWLIAEAKSKRTSLNQSDKLLS